MKARRVSKMTMTFSTSEKQGKQRTPGRIRVLAFADCHLGEEGGGLSEVIEGVERHAPDLVLFGGDLNRTSQSYLTVWTAREIIRLLRTCVGRRIPILLIGGNHRPKTPGSLSPLSPLHEIGYRGTYLATESPELFSLEAGGCMVEVLAIPWTPTPLEEVLQRVKDLREKMSPDALKVGLAHWMVGGARTSRNVPVYNLTEDVVPLSYLRDLNLDLFVLGHVHFPQKWGDIGYCGATDNFSFGDAGAGYWLIEGEKKEGEWEWLWKRIHSQNAKRYEILYIKSPEDLERVKRKVSSSDNGERKKKKICYRIVVTEGVKGLEEEVVPLIRAAGGELHSVVVERNKSMEDEDAVLTTSEEEIKLLSLDLLGALEYWLDTVCQVEEEERKSVVRILREEGLI
ncbi:MAG: metallophosphoesterase [Candidatus Hadarchaeales archaeon]